MSVVAIDACECDDFDPVDADDALCIECVCGHVVDEHAHGFFRPCTVGHTDRKGSEWDG